MDIREKKKYSDNISMILIIFFVFFEIEQMRRLEENANVYGKFIEQTDLEHNLFHVEIILLLMILNMLITKQLILISGKV